jgi:hypothetical protein
LKFGFPLSQIDDYSSQTSRAQFSSIWRECD